MGAERGIPDFASVDIREALPKWLVNSQIVEDSGDAQPLHLPFFLPRALPVLGLLHIFANGSKDIESIAVLAVLFQIFEGPGEVRLQSAADAPLYC